MINGKNKSANLSITKIFFYLQPLISQLGLWLTNTSTNLQYSYRKRLYDCNEWPLIKEHIFRIACAPNYPHNMHDSFQQHHKYHKIYLLRCWLLQHYVSCHYEGSGPKVTWEVVIIRFCFDIWVETGCRAHRAQGGNMHGFSSLPAGTQLCC